MMTMIAPTASPIAAFFLCEVKEGVSVTSSVESCVVEVGEAVDWGEVDDGDDDSVGGVVEEIAFGIVGAGGGSIS